MIPAVKALVDEIERRSRDLEDDKFIEIADRVTLQLKELNKEVLHLSSTVSICSSIAGKKIINILIQKEIRQFVKESKNLISDLTSTVSKNSASAVKFENTDVAARIEQPLNKLLTSIADSWTHWKNQEFNSLPIYKQAFGQVKDLQSITSKIDRISLQLRKFESPPSNKDNGKNLRDLITDKDGVQKMLTEAGVSKKISKFMIDASNENGSKLDSFDSDIKEWLSSYKILNRFKVVIDN